MTVDPDLPSSWLECSLGDAIDYGRTDKAEPEEIPADAWVLELEDVERDSSRVLQKITFAERRSKSTKNRFKSGDVLYGKLRPYLNKVVRASDSGFCTTEIVPLTPPAGLDSGYLFYWLKHPRFVEYVTSVSHGLNMPRLGTDAGKAAPFVLAPGPEQKRIADKLDALLARVDSCRERLDRVPGILKRFRQSVLAAATSGELTREWREERGIDPPITETLGDVMKVSSGKFLPAKEMTPGGTIPVFGGNGVNGYHDKANVEEQTLVIGRVGFYCGSVHLTPPLAWVTDNALIVRHDHSRTVRRFLYFALQAVDLRMNDSSTAQPVISGAKIYPTPIAIPDVLEQVEIVRRLDALLELAENLERQRATVASNLSRMVPSVLAKAFRGELVPQDPNDEPASKLLARLRTRPASAGNTGKPKRGGARRPRTKAKADTNMLTQNDVTPTHLTTILKERGALTAEALWTASQLAIDDFYDQLKYEEARGLLRENRGDSPTAPRLLESAV